MGHTTHILSGFMFPSMPDGPFLNFKKFEFSHQVALVGEDHYILKSVILFAMTICLNLDNYFYYSHCSCLMINFAN